MNLTDGSKTDKYLVETALLGHGLLSIKDEEILSIWPKGARVSWVEDGKIKIGSIEEFIPIRSKNQAYPRIDGSKLKKELDKNSNGCLTASGTMEVAKAIGAQVVVTAGMGGIGDIKAESLCYDLPSLAKSKITLISTSPKDMLDIEGSLDWLYDHKVNVLGFETDICNGYILKLKPYKLKGKLTYDTAKDLEYGCNLVLNPIPEEKRIQEDILEEAIKCGKKAEEINKDYHPAVNACFDRLSSGLSSKIQLESLISNIKVAHLITER